MTTCMKLLEAKAFWGVDELQARLVAAVDERDAARKLYDERQDDWIAERESLQALNMQLVKNHDVMQAERDAAQAGEARAVEAVRRCHEGAARQLAEPRDHDNDQYALTVIATDCEAILAAQRSALDWLAQQRREAAAEALAKLATDLRQDPWGTTLHDVDSLRKILCTRAAALRAGATGGADA